MSQSSTVLSKNQRQVIADLGIDAWYLTPAQRKESAADQAHRLLLDELVDSLTAPECSVAEVVPEPPAKNMPQTEGKTPQKVLAHSDASMRQRHVLQAPQPIKIPSVGERGIPDGHAFPVAFPLLAHASWDGVETACQQLASEQGLPCFCGVGQRDAEDLLLFPTPALVRKNAVDAQILRHLGLGEKERQLLGELFASLGLNLEASYQTCLTKCPTAYGQDPDEPTIEKHASLLATELALVEPRRVWVFGALPSQVISKTGMPLSALTEKTYEMTFKGLSNDVSTAHLVFLPTLDYLLAIPAEKGRVWRQVKSLPRG